MQDVILESLLGIQVHPNCLSRPPLGPTRVFLAPHSHKPGIAIHLLDPYRASYIDWFDTDLYRG